MESTQKVNFTIEVTRAQIRAALLFSAEKDIRYYLNGVMLHVGECGDARLVATDGHRLAVVKVCDQSTATPGEYIIPSEYLKTIKKASRTVSQSVFLTIEGDSFRIVDIPENAILCGSKLIDGKFPDWQRMATLPDIQSLTPGAFNPVYLADIQKALKELGSSMGFYFLIQNAERGAVVMEQLGFMCVVMAIREDKPQKAPNITQFMPRRKPSAIIETATGALYTSGEQTDDDSSEPGELHHSGEQINSTSNTSGEQIGAIVSRKRKKPRTYEFPAAHIKIMEDGTCREFPKFCPMISVVRSRAWTSDALRQLRAHNKAQGAPEVSQMKPSGEAPPPKSIAPLIPGRWIPGGADKAERIAFDTALGVEVWLMDLAGKLSIIAYRGKRTKRDAYYLIKDRERALQWAAKYLSDAQADANRQAERRADKKAKRAAGHKLTVGDVLRSSWGYDQTNIDYYEVTKLIGKSMVEIREIGRESIESGSMTGECVPRPGHYIGEPMRKTVSDYDGQSVRIASYAHAYKIEPQEVGGVKVYPVDRWTAYA